MSNKPENGFNGIFKEDAEHKRDKQRQHIEITARQYFVMIQKDPKIAQLSGERLWEIIESGGVVKFSEEDQLLNVTTGYELFRKELFGVDRSIYQMVEHIKVKAQRGSTGKQIPILVGPPGSGKSTAVSISINNLENYNKHQLFTIKGCPKWEDPLHLLPRNLRKVAVLGQEDCPECADSDIPKHLHLGTKIEGDLCPVCRDLLLTKYKDNDGVVRWWDVPVETFTFSIQGRRGISSFEPSDQVAADITILSGRENIAVTSVHGYKHPRAYELSGEIPAGERGIVEGREILSSDPSVLRVFFSVAQEQQLKIEGSYFPHISVDTVIIGHTNLTVFKEFSSNKKYEGLHDRFNVIPWPYPIEIKEEVKLYKKLIEKDGEFVGLKKYHIAPGSFELAALFAIMTRLLTSKMGIDVLTKAKIYNGDRALADLRDKDKKPVDRRELLAEGQSDNDIAKREGMFGLSSRTILSALEKALAKESGLNGCLTPLNTLITLREVFDHRMGLSPEDINRYREMLSAGEKGTVLTEYKEFVTKTVNDAFLRAYNDLAEELVRQYREEAALYRSQKRKFIRGDSTIKRDKLTGKPREANEKLLRSLEEKIPISASEADTFRGEILENPGESPMLLKAAQERLLEDNKSVLRLVLSPDKPQTEESKKRAQDLLDGLKDQGCCPTCSREFIEKASEFLNE